VHNKIIAFYSLPIKTVGDNWVMAIIITTKWC